MKKPFTKRRRWGYPVEFEKTKKGRRVTKIKLYLYEKVELARANIAACRSQAEIG